MRGGSLSSWAIEGGGLVQSSRGTSDRRRGSRVGVGQGVARPGDVDVGGARCQGQQEGDGIVGIKMIWFCRQPGNGSERASFPEDVGGNGAMAYSLRRSASGMAANSRRPTNSPSRVVRSAPFMAMAHDRAAQGLAFGQVVTVKKRGELGFIHLSVAVFVHHGHQWGAASDGAVCAGVEIAKATLELARQFVGGEDFEVHLRALFGAAIDMADVAQEVAGFDPLVEQRDPAGLDGLACRGPVRLAGLASRAPDCRRRTQAVPGAPAWRRR